MNREKEVIEIYIDDIIPNRFQPRLTFDEQELDNLAASIKQHGIIQPLVVRRLGDKFEIIAGERRYKASQIAGLTKVPAVVVEVNDNESAEIAVVENLQRKNLSAIEEAQSYKKILNKGYLNQEMLAKKMGISQSNIANKLRLLNLTEEAQKALLDNKISERHARSLLQLKDATDQVLMLNKIITNRLTVKQTDAEIKKILSGENMNEKTNEAIIENISDFFGETKKEENIKLEEPLFVNKKPEEKINNENVETEEFDLEDLLKPIKEEKLVKEQKPKEIKEEKKEEKTFENQLTPFQDDTIVEEFEEENKEEKKDFLQLINTARNTIKDLEKEGYQVDTEEFDFEDMYQIIIKIQK